MIVQYFETIEDRDEYIKQMQLYALQQIENNAKNKKYQYVTERKVALLSYIAVMPECVSPEQIDKLANLKFETFSHIKKKNNRISQKDKKLIEISDNRNVDYFDGVNPHGEQEIWVKERFKIDGLQNINIDSIIHEMMHKTSYRDVKRNKYLFETFFEEGVVQNKTEKIISSPQFRQICKHFDYDYRFYCYEIDDLYQLETAVVDILDIATDNYLSNNFNSGDLQIIEYFNNNSNLLQDIQQIYLLQQQSESLKSISQDNISNKNQYYETINKTFQVSNKVANYAISFLNDDNITYENLPKLHKAFYKLDKYFNTFTQIYKEIKLDKAFLKSRDIIYELADEYIFTDDFNKLLKDKKHKIEKEMEKLNTQDVIENYKYNILDKKIYQELMRDKYVYTALEQIINKKHTPSASLADTYERASKLANLQKDVQIANHLKQEAKIYAEDEQEKIEIYNYNKQQIEKNNQEIQSYFGVSEGNNKELIKE